MYFKQVNKFNDDTIRLMTLIVALKSKNGIVLAGDKRNYDPKTTGYDDKATKVFRINDRVAIGGSGDRFNCKEIIDAILAEPKIKTMDIEEVKDLMSQKAKDKQAEWLNAHKDNMVMVAAGLIPSPQFGFILVGFSKDNRSKMYSIINNSLTPLLIDDNHCQVGWVDISKYLFLKNYKEDMTLEGMSDLAKLAIEGTSEVLTAVSKDMDLIKIAVL